MAFARASRRLVEHELFSKHFLYLAHFFLNPVTTQTINRRVRGERRDLKEKKKNRALSPSCFKKRDAGGRLQATRLPLQSKPMPYKNITPPAGDKISIAQGKLNVPDRPVIPFIRGDGTGPDIWAASERVFDAAVEKASGEKKKISWFEVFAGQAAKDKFDEWLPDDTVEAFREYLIGIKGPLTTPVGGGISSLNVALRQMLDLFVCLRPVQYFKGVPSPVKHPEKVNMVIFRENTEDIYAGIEYAAGSEESAKILGFHREGISEGVRQDSFRHERKGGGVLEISRRAGGR